MTPAVAIADPYFRERLAGAFPVNGQMVARISPKKPGNQSIREVSNDVAGHAAVPFDANKNAKGMDMNSSSVVRKLPSTPDEITKEYTAERVSFALQAWGRERASPIKCLQRLTGVSRKAAEAWWHGRYPPQSDNLLTLARKIPELKAEVRRLLELEQDHAESFQREAIALLQRYAK